jgi:tryptophanyl-tRNA synthetase
MKRVFSGVQPTGDIHLGNYVGAMKQFVGLQDEHECFYCIVDLHALTVPQDPEALRKTSYRLAAIYLAIGLDPKKSTLFIQSQVSAHAELGWLLSCISYFGELSRMTQFKDKSKGKKNVSSGLFMYPVLMAADILLYQTDFVPVGNDQEQHLELARTLAARFNNRFGEAFVMPQGIIPKEGARIMSLVDPSKKMSKSDEDGNGRINLLDSPGAVKKKIMKATTDSESVIRYDEDNKPGVSNLLNIYSVMSGMSVPDIVKKYEGCGYGVFKKDLVDVINENLSVIQDRCQSFSEEQLESILRDGSEKAQVVAEKTLNDVKRKIGLAIF